MPFLSKPTHRVSAARRPSGEDPAKPKQAVPPKPPAKPQPARVRKQPSRPVPTGASAYVIEARRELGTILGEAGWTQAQLARAIGVKYWTVVRWESGRKAPTQCELDVIARVLELARRGIDPLRITAPNVEALLETPGPAKPPKNRSILRPDGHEPPTRHFKSVEPLKPAS